MRGKLKYLLAAALLLLSWSAAAAPDAFNRAYSEGVGLVDQGFLADARPVLLEAASLARADATIDRVKFHRVLNLLGEIQIASRSLVEAEMTLKEAVIVGNASSTIARGEQARALAQLGTVFAIGGSSARGQRYLKKALDLAEQQVETNHPVTLFPLIRLADFYLRIRNCDKAEFFLDRAAEVLKNRGYVYPADAVRSQTVRLAHYVWCLETGPIEDPRTESAFTQIRTELPSIHPAIVTAFYIMGYREFEAKNFKEAESLLNTALVRGSRSMGQNWYFRKNLISLLNKIH